MQWGFNKSACQQNGWSLSYLEDVARAVSQACRRPLKNVKGFLRVMVKYMVMRQARWMTNPSRTVTM